MRYREILNVGGKQLEYNGIHIKLYGLDDLFINYYYNELLRAGYLSTAASFSGISHEATRGNTDKQLRCIAETTEGRKLLSNHAYWGSEVHLAADGEYRWAPDWYIDPKGPTGYVVRDKMYSKYLYGPLSKEEFYRRNVGRGIPEPPGAFTTIFGGVAGLFTSAIGLSRLMTPDPPPEVIPVRERLDLGLIDPVNIPLPDTDDRDLDSLPGDLDSMPGGPEEEEAEEEVKKKPVEPVAEEGQEEPEEEESQPLPTISKDVVVPTDKAEYQRFLDRAKEHISVGMDRIDTANKEELARFAEQLDIMMAGKSIAFQRNYIKSFLIKLTAERTKSNLTVFNDLLTYQTIDGANYLPLAPDTVAKVETGLDIISRKFTFDDLKAYGSIHAIRGASKQKVDTLRKMVLSYYISKVAEDHLTPSERKKFKPDKHKREYGIQ